MSSLNNMSVGELYGKSRAASLRESIKYAQAELNTMNSDFRYYMCMPRMLIISWGTRLLLSFTVCILACYSFFTVATPPIFIIVLLKWKNYRRLCSSVNISPRKLNLLLAFWLILSIFINIIFWDLITSIIF